MILSRIEQATDKADDFTSYQTLLTSGDGVDPCPEEFVTLVPPTISFSPGVINLSVIDQVVVRCWSSYVLCWEKPAGHTNQQIFRYLKSGLQKTIDQFPFIAGEIVPKKNAKGGSIEVVVGPESSVAFGCRDMSRLSVASGMSFAEIKQLNFPPSIMESAELGIAPDPELFAASSRQPAFIAQATFVRGGCFLFLAHSHQITDVAGTNSIMQTWSANTTAAACGTAPVFSEALRDVSQSHDRTRINSEDRVDPDIPVSYFPFVIDERPCGGMETLPTKVIPQTQVPTQNPSMIWRMSPDRLQALKDLAWPTGNEECSYISTLDAVNALMWRAVCRARRLQQRNIDQSHMYFVCDIRRKLTPPIRTDSTCNATMKLHTAQDSADIQGEDLAASLSHMASSIRQVIRDFTPSHFGSWVSYAKSAPSYGSLRAKERLISGPDIIVTDHSKVAAYEYEWGPLGRIQRIRNPWWARSAPKPFSQITLMPRLRCTSLEILTNFEDSVNLRLLSDPELRQFACVQCC